MNPRLRIAVEAAKKASMTKDTLERAIKKGAGLLDEPVTYETVTYEGFAPHQSPSSSSASPTTAIAPRRTCACCSAKASSARRARCRGTSRGSVRSKRPPPDGGADADEAAIEAGAQGSRAG
jgi:hypothetical protein